MRGIGYRQRSNLGLNKFQSHSEIESTQEFEVGGEFDEEKDM